MKTARMEARHKLRLVPLSGVELPIFQNNMTGKKMKYTSLSEVFRKVSLVMLKCLRRLPRKSSVNIGNMAFRMIIALKYESFIVFANQLFMIIFKKQGKEALPDIKLYFGGELYE